MSTPASLSVIIVSYNTREMTLDCLRALFDELQSTQARTPLDADVWVVDNASRDGSAAAIRAQFPFVHLIENKENLGFGAANNQAMRQAQGEYFLLLNSDAFVRHTFPSGEELKSGAIEKLIAYLEANEEIALVGPRLRNADGSLQSSVWRFPSPLHAWLENSGLLLLLSKFAPPDSPFSEPLDWKNAHQTREHFISGACFLVRRSVFEKHGGFDENFHFYAEETDWQRRLVQTGWKMAFLPEAEVVHLGGASGANAAETETRLAARESAFTGLDRYALKHHGRSGLVSLRLATTLGNFVRAALWWGVCASTRLGVLKSKRSIAPQRARLHSWLFWRQLTRWKWR